jgi:hypothetical protein
LTGRATNKKVNVTEVWCRIECGDVVMPLLVGLDGVVGEVTLLHKAVDVASEGDPVVDAEPLESMFDCTYATEDRPEDDWVLLRCIH